MSRLKVMTVIGTRPEIIRLSEVIKKCDKYFEPAGSYQSYFAILSA